MSESTTRNRPPGSTTRQATRGGRDGNEMHTQAYPLESLGSLRLKGRGAQSNHAGRFETRHSETVEDGWGTDPRATRIKTEQLNDTSRSLITCNQSPDIPFDRSVNPYRGCEHGCSYCFARPTHTYLGFSAGLDFETRIMVKHDAATLLADELQKPSYRCDTIALSPNTDCYQPIEKELRITREILEVLKRCHHPVSIITKSALVQRDIDLLAEMARDNLANVVVSVTTLNAKLSAQLEPRASAPHRRIQTIEKLASAGIPVGVLVAPVIPFINDNEMETILETCHHNGATSAGYVLLRLPLEVRDLWLEWLETHYPDRLERVMKAIRASRGGKDYEAEFGTRMSGTGELAGLIRQRFDLARQKFSLKPRSTVLNTSLFNPSRLSDQLTLF